MIMMEHEIEILFLRLSCKWFYGRSLENQMPDHTYNLDALHDDQDHQDDLGG